jgi:N-glycosylase/DNA lyase
MNGFAALTLRGPQGEPVDLRRTLLSHGVASLPPATVDARGLSLTVTLAAPGGPRTVRVTAGADGPGAPSGGRDPHRDADRRRPRHLPAAGLSAVDTGPPVTEEEASALTGTVRRMLCLDDDLSPFYAAAARDPALAWACSGAGRMLRGPTVFEDVVKTVCTTNCAWSATERMVAALVRGLGERAPGAPDDEAVGRAFPTAAAMAAAPESFYRETVRAGYRGPRLRALAASVTDGEVDLEELYVPAPGGLSDDDVERRLLALPGVGAYAAAHIMMLLGRHSRLVFDAWTRPKYARLTGAAPGRLVPDATVRRRFRRYGAYAGLAFWLVLTRDWLTESGEVRGR